MAQLIGLLIGNISLILTIVLIIAILGLYLTKEIIEPVVKIADEAKEIAEGACKKGKVPG